MQARQPRLRRAVEGIDTAERSGSAADLSAQLSAAVAIVVPHSGYCLIWFDPISAMRGIHVANDAIPQAAPLVDHEALQPDLHRFADLGQTCGVVGLLGTGHPAERHSVRLHQLIRPAGFAAEARVALRSDNRLWAALVLLRDRSFTEEEAALLSALAPALTRAVRCHPITATGTPPAPARPPGVLVVGADNTVEATTSEARGWLSELYITAPAASEREAGQTTLPLAVRAAVHAARARSRAALCRTRTLSGRWLALQAAPLDGGEPGRVAITLQTATAEQLLAPMLAWHGLTARESDVTAQLLAGLPVKQIARRLEMSNFTVNDHLKAIYRKTGAAGRQQLAARLTGLSAG